MSDRKLIVIKKKKQAGHAHHGGSWKVAYADFVTAMMAFFMVMWIMGMDQGVRDLVQGYFENPVGFQRGFSGGRNILSQGNSIVSLEVRRTLILKRRQEEEARLQETARALETELREAGLMADLAAAVEVVVTPEGLRIEIMETGEGSPFFDRASANLSPSLRAVLSLVARQIAPLPNGLVVEGHTDAMPFDRAGYTNWELSVDRANSARRALVEQGFPADHVVEVRGYADLRPKVVEDPLNARNRRITLLLPFDTPRLEDLTEEELEGVELTEDVDLVRVTPMQ